MGGFINKNLIGEKYETLGKTGRTKRAKMKTLINRDGPKALGWIRML